MISHFIEGYDRKYSIREDGNVILHRKSKSPRSNFRDEFCWDGIELSKRIIKGRANVSLSLRNKVVLQLMVKYFNLQPPSEDFTYTPYCIDGDPMNTALNNIGWRFLGNRNNNAQAIYENGCLVKIKCCECGEWKESNYFHRLSSKCAKCDSRQIRSKLADGYIIYQLTSSGFPADQITPELIEAKRAVIKLYRGIYPK